MAIQISIDSELIWMNLQSTCRVEPAVMVEPRPAGEPMPVVRTTWLRKKPEQSKQTEDSSRESGHIFHYLIVYHIMP